MKRRIDRAMDKPITTIILLFIITIFMVLAVACSQPIEEKASASINHQGNREYKVLPLVVIHDEVVETEAETEAETEEGKKMMITAFAYCPCISCCGKTDGITSTGTQAMPGRTIAVDPSVIPYGSRVVIDGHTYVAEDCGGAIKGNTIDVFHATHEEALQWGIKYVEAVVYPAEEGVTK